MPLSIDGFEHLHLHTTEGSLLDGFGFVKEYSAKWKGHGDYLCISDHGMMSSIPSQIRNCKATNDKDDPYKDKSLNPIFACELYVNPLQIQYFSDKEFKDYQKTLDPDQLKSLRKSYHLLAIAHNEIGYRNLVTLSSLAWINGYYYRARVNHELLIKYKEGITFSSCCYASEIGQAFDKGGEEAGFAMIEKYMAMFGEHFVLEFMLLDFEKQKPYDVFILKAKEKYKLPIIVTNDCHFCNEEDSHNQHLMLMVQTKVTLKDIERVQNKADGEARELFALQDTNLWQKTEEEINEKWQKDYSSLIDYELFREAKRTTVEICRKAGNVKLDRSMKLPQIPDANDKLREAVIEGFKSRNLPKDKVYGNRLREEFELIFNKGFSSYFLILKSTVDEARRYSMQMFGHPNVIGPGRGCLSGNTHIVLSNGTSKPISEFNTGDKVIGRDGSINKVKTKLVYKIDEDLIRIKTYYGDNRGVTLTKDHKILAEKLVRPINYENWSKSTRSSVKSIVEPTGNLEWIEAGNLSIGDWVFIPNPIVENITFDTFDLSKLNHQKSVLTYDNEYVYQSKLNPITKRIKPVIKLPRYLHLSEGWYRVLGMFAGDGWMKTDDSSTEVGFAFHEDDFSGQKLLELVMGDLGLPVKFIKHEFKKLVQGKIYSRHLQLFIKHCFPDYRYTPETKHIPSFVFNQDNLKKQAFLRGYFGADGNDSQYKCSFSTISKDLANQTRFLCWQLGIPASMCFCDRLDKRTGRKSVETKINVPHCDEISETELGQLCFYRSVKNGLIVSIRDINIIESEKEVFDLEVENQHDYLTTSFQVHNSCVGSLVCYCLRATNVDPIQHDLLFSRFLSKARNDLPDADVDFLKDVRDYLKSDWAPNHFGKEYVANIGIYNTFGLKSSLLDMAKVHDKDRNEIINITTKLGLKDDEGDALTFDKALEIYPDLSKYCAENPEVRDATKKLINRSKSMGKHAGGIIISSVPINQYIPLVRGKEGEIVTGWTEGLHDQDLGPMGFVKYDWLVITNLEQINYACKIIKERHGLTSICAKPGQEDWSDTTFLNDPLAIKMANEADLKGIFQFDSDGIRNLARKGGVDTFNDLVAYASLFRPGPMSEGMHEEYCARKKGLNEYTIHPLLKPILATTYGVICYQEQCMKILHVVGDIPLEDCEILRKAISKKKEDYFAKYKVMFVQNGMKNLGWVEEEVVNIWKLLEAFAGYAFNLSHACAYTYISSMLLYLKSHYTLEFYTAILHFEKEAEKIKEYRLDAQRHNIIINPLDLNKSKIKFDIVDNQIYFGFANVKGIGEMVAEKIIANQPYKGFNDFLLRFGTDESVVKPLIGLRMFGKDPMELYQFYKWLKDIKEKRVARQGRFVASCGKDIATAKELGFDIKDHNDILKLVDEREEVQKLVVKHDKLIQNYFKRSTVADELPGFDQYALSKNEETEVEGKKEEMPEKLKVLFESPEECEKQFYGFLWHHPICNSPDYEGGRTFDIFKERGLPTGYVEVMIDSVAKQTSKKNTNYWLVKAEDSNGESVQIQVWEDDWERFKDDLKAGQYVKLEVKAPDKGFYRYTLYSPPKWQRTKLIPKSRSADMRVWVLRKEAEVELLN